MFNKWFTSMRDKIFLNPVKARDIIIECFYTAQQDTFARQKEKANPYASSKEVKDTVTAAIRAEFKAIGADFDNPRKKDLVEVVEILATKAKSWGTPDDIIQHHKGQIAKVLDALSE